ncbi:unnamed protein product, partial [Prorocentrum cordatum]
AEMGPTACVNGSCVCKDACSSNGTSCDTLHECNKSIGKCGFLAGSCVGTAECKGGECVCPEGECTLDGKKCVPATVGAHAIAKLTAAKAATSLGGHRQGRSLQLVGLAAGLLAVAPAVLVLPARRRPSRDPTPRAAQAAGGRRPAIDAPLLGS